MGLIRAKRMSSMRMNTSGGNEKMTAFSQPVKQVYPQFLCGVTVMKKTIVFVLVFAFALSLVGCGSSSTATENNLGDRRPMIMVDDKIYLDTGKLMTVEIAESEILGTITSSGDSTEIPKENGESNFGFEGAQYAYLDDGLVVMLQDGWVFFEQEAE
jgi:hypothetical protein